VGYPDGSKAYKVILYDGKVFKARSVICAETTSSEVANVPENSPVEHVVEDETGWDAGSDDLDVDAEDDGGDNQQNDGSDKSADDNTGSTGCQDTLRRSGRSSRPPVKNWRPGSLVAHEAPMTYGQAVRGQESTKWRAAMDQQVDFIRKNKTWLLTDRMVCPRVLKGKWVFKVKDELDKVRNNTTRHKARLCFMGNRQIKGLNLNETFAPVAKFTTIRCILAVKAANGSQLHQMSVKKAFLKGEYDKEVLMEQPEGYVDPTFPDKLHPLLQALYELKQDPKMSYVKLKAYLKLQRLHHIDPDACSYRQMDDGQIIIVLVYVVDLLLVASSLATIYKIKNALHQR